MRREGGVTIGALRAFVAVVEQGGFSRAAAELGMTQPNISNLISGLETACGLRLIHRRSANQILTDAGQELYLRARLVISRMNDFEVLANTFGDLRRGRIVVGFSTPPVALRLIGAFMKSHPEIELMTRLGNTASLVQDVLECRADLAILSLTAPEEQLACHLIARQALRLIVPAGHPLASRNQVALAVLPGLSLVVREQGSVTRALSEAALAKAGAAFSPVLEVGSREAVKEAVANGVGAGFVLEGEIGEDARIASLRIVDFKADAGVYLVSVKESLEIPAVAAFAALASQQNTL